MNKSVSAIVPAYESAGFLAGCIESALNQTHRNIEVVVVNDGSSDNTDDVVKPYLSRISYIKQKNKGVSAARNAGFRASKGEFVCFLDADDILLPDKFERQIARFEEEPDLGVVIGGYYDVDVDGETIIQTVQKQWNRDGLARLLNHEVFPPHAALIRREVFEKSAMFPEDIETGESQEDWQLWLDLALDGVQFGSVPEPTCKYRRNVNGSISSNLLKHNDGARRVVNWLRNDARAKKYAREVERLAAIVEMERVARAWQMNEHAIAATTLADAVVKYPSFWSKPRTFGLLFERTLNTGETAAWNANPELCKFETTVIKGILSSSRSAITDEKYKRLCAVAYLQLVDLAYNDFDDSQRKHSIGRAMRASLRACFGSDQRGSFCRGVLGPRMPSSLKAILSSVRRNGEEK